MSACPRPERHPDSRWTLAPAAGGDVAARRERPACRSGASGPDAPERQAGRSRRAATSPPAAGANVHLESGWRSGRGQALMMGHSHALSGGLLWLVAAPTVAAVTGVHLGEADLAAGTLACA